MENTLPNQRLATENAEGGRPGAVGSPLPKGAGGQPQPPPRRGELKHFNSVPPAQHPLTKSPSSDPAADLESDRRSGLQRAGDALRVAAPFVRRILPLLDGNIATAVANLLGAQPQGFPFASPAGVSRVEKGLTKLETQHADLRDRVQEQNSALIRVEDKLEQLREATDRSTLEQQELLQDLKTTGSKMKLIAVLALGLLVISVVTNVFLLLYIRRIFP